ncbi:hypothetical protein ACIBBE_34565 [Streptomyces sp. NPDC051644]
MAALRSFAVDALQNAGHTNIAVGLHEKSCDTFHSPLNLLDLP